MKASTLRWAAYCGVPILSPLKTINEPRENPGQRVGLKLTRRHDRPKEVIAIANQVPFFIWLLNLRYKTSEGAEGKSPAGWISPPKPCNGIKFRVSPRLAKRISSGRQAPSVRDKAGAPFKALLIAGNSSFPSSDAQTANGQVLELLTSRNC